MGRKPLSDEEKRRRGTFQPCRSAAARAARAAHKASEAAATPAVATAPDPGRRGLAIAAPPPPRHLSAVARAAWREVAAQLAAAGIAPDRRVLELYAVAIAGLRAAVAEDPAGRAALRWMALADKLRRDLGAPITPPTPAAEAPAAPAPMPTRDACEGPLDPMRPLARGEVPDRAITEAFLFGGRRLLHPLPPHLAQSHLAAVTAPPRAPTLPAATEGEPAGPQPDGREGGRSFTHAVTTRTTNHDDTRSGEKSRACHPAARPRGFPSRREGKSD